MSLINTGLGWQAQSDYYAKDVDSLTWGGRRITFTATPYPRVAGFFVRSTGYYVPAAVSSSAEGVAVSGDTFGYSDWVLNGKTWHSVYGGGLTNASVSPTSLPLHQFTAEEERTLYNQATELGIAGNDERTIIFMYLYNNSIVDGGVSEDYIRRLSVTLEYPNDGVTLATRATVDSDVGFVSVGAMQWRDSNNNIVTSAVFGEQYTVYMDVTGTLPFGSTISPTANDSSESQTYLVGSTFQRLNDEHKGIVSLIFGKTDVKTPYDAPEDPEDDPIDEPDLPVLKAIDTGFITIYNPTLAEVKSLATYMWNADVTTLDFWRKLVADPMDLILGFSIVPCAVPDGGQKSVVVGLIDTQVSMNLAASQFVVVDCGSLTVSPMYNTYLDYAPYTSIALYLPYIGVKQINTDEVMGKTVAVKYHIDILTGACAAYIIVDGSVMYCFTGQCATPLPVTSAQYSEMIRGAIQLVTAVGAAVMTGGTAGGAIAADLGIGAGVVAGADIALNTFVNSELPAPESFKPPVERSGALGSSAGLMAVQTPYFIINRPRASMPPSQNVTQGYPCNQFLSLSSCTGFTQVQSIRLEGITCTADELQEIYSALSKGVII